jgi:hypothetical protein
VPGGPQDIGKLHLINVFRDLLDADLATAVLAACSSVSQMELACGVMPLKFGLR